MVLAVWLFQLTLLVQLIQSTLKGERAQSLQRLRLKLLP